MEDYKKKYEEALERMKSWARGEHPECFSEAQKAAEFIFPELAEVDDRKIRKWLINLVKSHIRWLEDRVKEQLSNGQIYGGELSKAQVSLTWLEKQGEQRSTDNDGHTDYNSIDPCFGKPIDKIEPKFKFNVGQWIVATGKCVYLIVKIDGFNITLIDTNDNEYVFDANSLNDAHLWTIKDAKPNDVLYSKKHNLLWIYKNAEQCVSCINLNYSSNISIGSDIVIPNDTCPATKEQCDLLFQKMKEVGYEWKNNQLEEINNKGFVDLGLPSGTLWATCNLGAEKETDFGMFFQWGDMKGYKGVDEHQFSWSDYKFGKHDSITKYNDLDNKLILDNEDDPVFASTNGKFKMPTKEQLQELIDHTDQEWTNIDGIEGMKFINKEDDTKYIFIPAAGYCSNGSHYDVGYWGYAWSVSCEESYAGDTWYMGFNAGDVYMDHDNRCLGFSVRGVMNS